MKDAACLRLSFSRKRGDFLHIRGPKGNGFYDRSYNVIGIAGGSGIGPIHFGMQEGKVKKLLYGARTADSFIKDSILDKIEVHYATDNGTRGHHGFVTDLIEKYVTYDDIKNNIWVCGPEPMMKKTFDTLKGMYDSSGEVFRHSEFSLERYMKCGSGICGACSCSGYLTCSDGPVIKYDDLKTMPDFGNLKRTKSGTKVKI